MHPVRLLDLAVSSTREARSRIGRELGARLTDAMRDPGRMLPLWRAFSRGEPVPAAELTAAMGDELAHQARREGLLTEVDAGDPAGPWLRGTVCVLAASVGGELVWVASDFPWFEDLADAVGGPGAATETLCAVLPTREWHEVVDLGSGSGALGVRLAVGDAELTAVDINPRAVAITELTAALNDRPLTAVCGDLTAPVTGSHELIVCNPPFVIGRPSERTTFRDCEDPAAYAELAHDIAPLLAEDGVGAYLTNWPYGPNLPDPLAALRESLSSVPSSDVLVLERALVTAADYVAIWTDDPDTRTAWASTLSSQGITHLGTGAVVLRRIEDDEHTYVSIARPYEAPLDTLSGLVDGWLSAQQLARELGNDTVLVAAPYAVGGSAEHAAITSADPLGLSVTGPADDIHELAQPLLEAVTEPTALEDAIGRLPRLRSAPRLARDLARVLARAGLLQAPKPRC